MAKRGRKPISEEKKAEILAEYGDSSSHRETARRCGVSRTLVQNVVNGRHGKILSQSSLPKLGPGEVNVVATRCSNGHLVQVWPCRECLADVFKRVARRDALRELELQSERRAAGVVVSEPPLLLELSPDERAAYEQIRRSNP